MSLDRLNQLELFQQIFDCTLSPMLVIDRQGNIMLVNGVLESVFGYGNQELLGKKIEVLVPERFRGQHPERREKFFQDPGQRSLGKGRDLFGLKKDGQEIHIEIGLNPIEIQGEMLVLATIFDITQRKKREEILHQIVELSANALLLVDETGRIQLTNAAATALFGYSREELMRMNVDEFFSSKDRANLARYRETFHQNPIKSPLKDAGALAGLKKDGSEVPVEVKLHPVEPDERRMVLVSIIDTIERDLVRQKGIEIKDELEKQVKQKTVEANRQRIAALNIMQDVIEAKKRVEKTEKELQVKAQDLLRSNKELEQFAYIASHDLQEPLRMVASYTQLLEKRYTDLLDDKGKQYVHFAVDGAQRMQQLISDLLSFSRVGSKAKEFAAVDLNGICEKAMKNLEIAFEENNAKVGYDNLPLVFGDDVQLIQLFQNLVGNAIKFHSAESPQVVIRAEEHGHDWLLSVSDNGIGLDEKYKDRIFNIFQRLHTKQEYKGTGIGLAVCKKIVERHGGRIWVKSKPGEGATFYFTMPKVKAP